MVPAEIIKRNLTAIKGRIFAAAERSGRSPEAVQLVAVTKAVGTEEIRILYDFGLRDFGENRIQQALARMESLSDLDIRWHMIGRLQTNKARKAAGAFHLLHSLDSIRLGFALDRAAQAQDCMIDTLVEVNVCREEVKAGFDVNELEAALAEVRKLEHVRLQGLMTMAPLTDNPEEVRPVYRGLRELRDRLNEQCGRALRHLSMGMTQDFEVAVEEGATMVRIGTALFLS
jgi:hypothetical protein